MSGGVAWASLSDDGLSSSSEPGGLGEVGDAWAALSDSWDSQKTPSPDSPVVRVAARAEEESEEAVLVGADGDPLVMPAAAAVAVAADYDEYGHGLPEQRLPKGRLMHRAIAALLRPVVDIVRSAGEGSGQDRVRCGQLEQMDRPPAMAIDDGDESAYVDGVVAVHHGVGDDARGDGASVAEVEAKDPVQPTEQGFGMRFSDLAIGLERARVIINAIRSHPKHDPRMDASTEENELVHRILHGPSSMINAANEAQLVGSSRWSVQRFRRMLAFAVLISHINDMFRMLTRVASDITASGGRCISLIDKYKGDETTLKYTVSDREQTGNPGISSDVVARQGVVAKEAVAKQAALSKLLQSHRVVGAVFETADKQRFMIRASIPMPLQVMSSTNQ